MVRSGASALVHCSVVWLMFHASLKVFHKGLFLFFQLKFRRARYTNCTRYSSVRSLMPYSPSSLSQQKSVCLLLF